MKIGQVDQAALVGGVQGDRKAQGKNPTGRPSEPSAQVDLSETAGMLSSSPTDASFDAEKVNQIAQAIRDGKFQVNAEAIADKMISNAREMLGRN